MTIAHTGLTVDQMIEALVDLQSKGYGSVHATVVTDADESDAQIAAIESDSNEYGEAVYVVMEQLKSPEQLQGIRCLTPWNCVLGTGLLRAHCSKCQAQKERRK